MSKSNKKTKQNSNKAVVRGQKSGKRQPNPTKLGKVKNAPVARSQQVKVGRPKIQQTDNGCIIHQRELITTLACPGNGFNLLKRLRCNPASQQTFPWLSTIAPSFEQYRFKKLHFEYIARCPTTLAGSVLMSPDYDAQDGQPLTEAIQAVYKGTVEDVPWESSRLVLEPQLMNRAYKAHFTMGDSRFSATTQDEKTIDVAQVFVSSDTDAAATLGKLWVDYVVELITPQPPVASPASGGLDLQISSVTTKNTADAFPINTNTVITARQLNPSDPILQLTNTSILGNTATQAVGTFLRDFTGMCTLNFTDATNGMSDAITGALHPSLLNLKNGLTTVLNQPVGGSSFGDAANIGGTPTIGKNTNYRSTQYISALAGDVLQLPEIGSINAGTFISGAVNLALASLPQNLPFA